MICHSIKLPADMLRHGANMDELKYRPECTISRDDLYFIHSGRDASIMDMIDGGNGWPNNPFPNHGASVQFDLGCTAECRDLRLLLAWQQSLQQCKIDKQRGNFK